MSIEIVERPATTLIGMSIRTKPQSPDIPALWPKFVARAGEIERQAEPEVAYGVMGHEPPDSLIYIAAVAVSPEARVPPGMESRSLPPGRYARFRYPLGRLGEGFGEIFTRLLPASGYTQAPGLLLERYDESFEPDDARSMVEILVPVRLRTM